MFTDLITRILPKIICRLLYRESYQFGFLIHPRDTIDLIKRFSWVRFLPKKIVLIFLRFMWPVTISEINGLVDINGKKLKGIIIATPLSPKQMMENRNLAKRKIISAIRFAKKRGVKLVGLGGLTSSLTRGGIDILPFVDVKITTGHACTVYSVSKNVLQVIETFEFKKEQVVLGIVGGAGSIGSNTAKYLVKQGIKNLILLDLTRKQDQLRKIYHELKKINQGCDIQISDNLNKLKDANIIVAATNAPEAVIKYEYLRGGTIIVNDAQPSDVDPDIILNKDDILVIEGGLLRAPYLYYNFNFRLQNKKDIFSCLAEVLVLAYLNKWNENFNVGRLRLENINLIENTLPLINLSISEFQNIDRIISLDEIDQIKKINKKHGSN